MNIIWAQIHSCFYICSSFYIFCCYNNSINIRLNRQYTSSDFVLPWRCRRGKYSTGTHILHSYTHRSKRKSCHKTLNFSFPGFPSNLQAHFLTICKISWLYICKDQLLEPWPTLKTIAETIPDTTSFLWLMVGINFYKYTCHCLKTISHDVHIN